MSDEIFTGFCRECGCPIELEDATTICMTCERMAFADHVYAASEPDGYEEQFNITEAEARWRDRQDALRVEDTMTAEDRKEQLGEECVYCGKDSWTCEHFKPEQESQAPYSLRDEGRNPDGSGESYASRNT